LRRKGRRVALETIIFREVKEGVEVDVILARSRHCSNILQAVLVVMRFPSLR
jgi:hypothetical protein